MPKIQPPHAASEIMAFGSIPFWPISSMTQASGQCFSRRGGDCKGNPFSPDPNPSDPLAWLDQTYLLIHPATARLLTQLVSAPLTPLLHLHSLPTSLYIPPHHRTLKPTRWTVGLMIVGTYHLDYFIPYLLPPSCLLTSLFRFH
jgi:hypothetical protein